MVSHRRFHSRLIVSVLLSLAIILSAVAQVRQRIDASKFINLSSRDAGKYFAGEFRYGGGVVPRGNAEFLSPTKLKLSARQLQLVILDKAKLANDHTDYDAIGISWNGQSYKLAAPDDFILPLMQFIQRGSYIIYTLPVAGFDKAYFQRNGLLPFRKVNVEGHVFMGYAAKEFKSIRQKEFLQNVDFANTTRMAKTTKASIIADIRNRVRGSNQPASAFGTYVNADFHVKYHFYLNSKSRVVDSDGLPLRYAFSVATDGTAIIRDIEVFAFPTTPYDSQDRAVLFFQTAALLRQFHDDNRPAFDRFLKEVAAVRKT
jgi:hypothetical protein